MNRNRSEKLWERAGKILVGGVNSPVRAFRSVGAEPLFFDRARGAKIADADGNEYIDLIGSWGPMILGHAHPEIVKAVCEAARRGFSFGVCSESEVMLAESVAGFFPIAERVRFVNSGTEAAMSALRLARGFTGRPKAIKFEGCYHGHGDSFLIKAGSGAATFGVPDSAGITEGTARDTLTANYNDLESVKALFDANPEQVAAVIVEPAAGNMGVVPPAPGFLQGLCEECKRNEALLIFDEVMTGFRIARGGAAERFGVEPDLVVLGKVIGGGFPVGAYAGPARIMEFISPLGPVYQAGTLSGNPVAMAAGLATLRILDENDALYDRLESLGMQLEMGLCDAIEKAGIPACMQRVGTMLTLFFHPGPIANFKDAARCDAKRFSEFFRAMLESGVLLPPSQFEAWFISAAHTDEDIGKISEACGHALKRIV